MLLNFSKNLGLGALINVRISGNRSICSFFNKSSACITTESLQKSLLPLSANIHTSILYNNRIVRSITTSSQTQSKSHSSSQSTTDSPQSSPNPELTVQFLNEGIVELQLNRPQGKNSLSKQILSEV
jgi:hypothetical protein